MGAGAGWGWEWCAGAHEGLKVMIGDKCKRLKYRRQLIAMLPRGTIGAEVGVYRGEFSEEILSYPVRLLYLVDAWEKQDDRVYCNPINGEDQGLNMWKARKRLEKFRDRCVFVRGLSADIARNNFGIPFLDWVYIDANHAYKNVREDLDLWCGSLRPGGIIMGHDYTDTHPLAVKYGFGVVRAVDEFCENFGWEMTYLAETEFPSYRLERKG